MASFASATATPPSGREAIHKKKVMTMSNWQTTVANTTTTIYSSPLAQRATVRPENPMTVKIYTSLPSFTLTIARDLALKHYCRVNALAENSCDEKEIFVARVTVNYLRHKWTSYDSVMRQVPPGAYVYRAVLKRRALEHIKSMYSELSEECERQISTLQYLP